MSGERDRDGDYALSDLGGLRSNPFVAARDFEGFTERDIVVDHASLPDGTVRACHCPRPRASCAGARKTPPTSTTRRFRLITRNNREESFQFTQEVRLASAANAPIRLSDGAALRWQTGVFLFTQDYEQDAANTFAPFLLSALSDFRCLFRSRSSSPQSELDDVGIGVYGQGTVTLDERLDLIAGVRADHETEGRGAPDVLVAGRSSRRPTLSPSVTSRMYLRSLRPRCDSQPGKTVYARCPADSRQAVSIHRHRWAARSYGEEHTWSLEGGVKTTWAGGRVMANASVFRIDWEELQLNLPDPFAPGQFFIATPARPSVPASRSRSTHAPLQGVDLFGSVGFTHARFDDGVVLGRASTSAATRSRTLRTSRPRSARSSRT